MKKFHRGKRDKAPRRAEPDIQELFTQLQEQLASMERKIDALMIHIPHRQAHAERQQEPRKTESFNERPMHKAVCADCGNDCEVPFKPSGDRPVYCKECFSKRKSGASFKENRAPRPDQSFQRQEHHSQNHAEGGRQRHSRMKKSSFKRRR